MKTKESNKEACVCGCFFFVTPKVILSNEFMNSKQQFWYYLCMTAERDPSLGSCILIFNLSYQSFEFRGESLFRSHIIESGAYEKVKLTIECDLFIAQQVN